MQQPESPSYDAWMWHRRQYQDFVRDYGLSREEADWLLDMGIVKVFTAVTSTIPANKHDTSLMNDAIKPVVSRDEMYAILKTKRALEILDKSHVGG